MRRVDTATEFLGDLFAARSRKSIPASLSAVARADADGFDLFRSPVAWIRPRPSVPGQVEVPLSGTSRPAHQRTPVHPPLAQSVRTGTPRPEFGAKIGGPTSTLR